MGGFLSCQSGLPHHPKLILGEPHRFPGFKQGALHHKSTSSFLGGWWVASRILQAGGQCERALELEAAVVAVRVVVVLVGAVQEVDSTAPHPQRVGVLWEGPRPEETTKPPWEGWTLQQSTSPTPG